MQICKACNVVKPLSAFPLRKWKTQQGEAREGPRKECYECQRAADNLRYNAPGSQKRKRHLQYNEENRESLRAYRESYYQANREKWLDRDNGWRFSDRAQAYDSAYRERPEVREATRVRGADWRANNKPRLLVKTRARQAHVARATPAWADLAAIQAIYDEAARLTR
ncbi:MAG TPA: hypothetical protein VN289_00585, partial [Paraburkholderia sp.]|nr:hypothetical protein [Paraburkholderia sp.]